MFMNRTIVWVIVIIVVVLGGGYYFRNRANTAATPPSESLNPPPAPISPSAETPALGAAKTYTILMTPGGFSPAELSVKVGDTVVFKNDDARDRWPASAMHPTHQVCAGFDAIGGVKSGESYSRTFTEAKVCPFHDHLLPKLFGKITVTQ